MVILGLSDGLDAGAALVIDNQLVAVELQERHDRIPRSTAFPWTAIGEVLEEAGLENQQVDQVAVAGQFAPSVFYRHHPKLRSWAADAFSPLVDAGVFFHSILRKSGIGEFEADREAEWLEKCLRERGFFPQRVHAYDIHKALGEAVYRTQPRSELLVFTLHPHGDGTAVAVWEGVDGQLDRTLPQRGFSSLHVHLQRCMSAMGLDPQRDEQRLWVEASRGTPDPQLVEMLAQVFHVDGARISWQKYPFPESRNAPVYRALFHAGIETAAASLLANLTHVVQSMIRYHIRATGIPHVGLAGSVFDNPRLCASIADLEEVSSVWVAPMPGPLMLAIGSAVGVGGLAPHVIEHPYLGRQYHEHHYERALLSANVSAQHADEAEAGSEILARGDALARFRGRAGIARSGSGNRSVLVRADDSAAVERVRSALRRSRNEEPACLWLSLPDNGAVEHEDKLRESLRYGSVAPKVDTEFAKRYPTVVGVDGRVRLQQIEPKSDLDLYTLLQALHRRTGIGAVACFPLAMGDEPAVSVPEDAIAVWRKSGITALQLGSFLLPAK